MLYLLLYIVLCPLRKLGGEKKSQYTFIVLVILTFLFTISLNLFLWIKIIFWCNFVTLLQLCYTLSHIFCFVIIKNTTSLYIIGPTIQLYIDCFIQLLSKSVKRRKEKKICIYTAFYIYIFTFTSVLCFVCVWNYCLKLLFSLKNFL